MQVNPIRINPTTELRCLAVDDAEALFAALDDNRQHLRQWLPWLDFNKESSDSVAFIKRSQKLLANGTGFVMGIWVADELVGTIGQNSIDWSAKIGYLGYWLSQSAQGNGIVTAACRALISHAFDELKLNRIDIRCATGNARSCAIPQRLGFTHEGVLRQAEWLYDHYVDHNVYGLLAGEWQSQPGN